MNFDINKDYYDILGITKDASFGSVDRAYARLRYGNSGENSLDESRMQKVLEAYRILSDIDKRKQYDEFLKNNNVNSISTTDSSTLENNGEVEENTSNLITSENNEEVGENTIDPTTSENNEEMVEDNNSNENVVEENNTNLENKDDQNEEELENQQIENAEENESNIDYKSNEIQTGPQYNRLSPNKMQEPQKMKHRLLKKALALGTEFVSGATIGAAISTFVLSAPTSLAIMATVGMGMYVVKIFENNNRKFMIDRSSKAGKITEVSTPESKIDKEYDANLKKDIDKILNGRCTNYGAEIAKARYNNRIALTKAKIDQLNNCKADKGQISRHLELTALTQNLKRLQSNLSTANEKINSSDKRVDRKLNKINTKLDKIDNILNSNNPQKQSILKIGKLKIYKSVLKLRKKPKVNKFKFKSSIAKSFKDGTLRKVDTLKNFGHSVFVDYRQDDAIQETSGRQM